jgi:hypothetical protein
LVKQLQRLKKKKYKKSNFRLSVFSCVLGNGGKPSN